MWPKRAVMADFPCLMHSSELPFDHNSSNAQTSSFQISYVMFSLPNTHLMESYWFLSILYSLQSEQKLIDFVVFMWEKIGWLISFHVFGPILNSNIKIHFK
jgi:hypothetical protein